MRVVVQRVGEAAVTVGGTVVGEIGRGLLVFAGFGPDDDEEVLKWMASRLLGLRVFADAEGRMNLDVREAAGEILVVSQFTLYGDCSRGRRPSFISAAPPERAEVLYRSFVDLCRRGTVPVAEGRFGAEMQVSLRNEGPVTLVIER
ncbi:MAG: D-aminoacyl-tRNA deacylase [Gemmatimonadota bacterium]